MSVVMDEEVSRWAAWRRSDLVLDSNQGKTMVAEPSRPLATTRWRGCSS